MKKTRIKSFSKRSLSIVLAMVILISALGIGSITTANAYHLQNGARIYFDASTWYHSGNDTDYPEYMVCTLQSSDYDGSAHHMTRIPDSSVYVVEYTQNTGWDDLGSQGFVRFFSAYTHYGSKWNGYRHDLNWGHITYWYNRNSSEEEQTARNYYVSGAYNLDVYNNHVYYFRATGTGVGDTLALDNSYDGISANCINSVTDWKSLQKASVYTDTAVADTFAYAGDSNTTLGGKVTVSTRKWNGWNSTATDSATSGGYAQVEGALGTQTTLSLSETFKGYEFDGWYQSDNTTLVTKSPTYTFYNSVRNNNVDEYIAHFKKVFYDDYRTWSHHDTRWSSTRMGNSTVGNGGAPTTAITKLAIQAGLRSEETFNIGSMATLLTANNGYSGSSIKWKAPSETSVDLFNNYAVKQAPKANNATYNSSGNYSTLIGYLNDGWYLVIHVKTSKGIDNYVAVDKDRTLADGSTVYIMDCLSDITKNADVALASRYSTYIRVIGYKIDGVKVNISGKAEFNATYTKDGNTKSFNSGDYVPNGATVNITATPNAGYTAADAWTISGGYTFSSHNGTAAAFTTNESTSKTANITYTPTADSHTVSYTKGTNSDRFDFTAPFDATPSGTTSAVTDAVVEMTVTPKDDGLGVYELNVVVTDSSDNEIPVNCIGNKYSFTMPASNVTVTFTGKGVDDWRRWARDDIRWKNKEMAEKDGITYTVQTDGAVMVLLAKLVIQSGVNNPERVRILSDREEDNELFFDVNDVVDVLKSANKIGETGALTFDSTTATTLRFASYSSKTSVENNSVDIYTNAANRKALVDNIKDGYHQVIRIYNSSGASEWFAIDEEKTLAAAGDKATVELSDIYIFRPTANAEVNANYTLAQLNDSTGGSLGMRYIRKNHAFLGGSTPSRKLNYSVVTNEGSLVEAHKGTIVSTYTIGDETTSFSSGDYVPSRATISISYTNDPVYYTFVNWKTSDTGVSSLSDTETASAIDFTIVPGEFRTTSGTIVNSETVTLTCNITPVIYNIYYIDGEHFSYSSKKSAAGYSSDVSFAINPDENYTINSVRFTDENDIDIDGVSAEQSNIRYTFNMPAQDVYISAEAVEQNRYDDFRTWGTGDDRWKDKIYSANNSANTINAPTRIVGGSDIILAYIKLLIQAGYTPGSITAYDSLNSATNKTYVEGIIDKLNVDPYPYSSGLVQNTQSAWASIANRLGITSGTDTSYCSLGATAGGSNTRIGGFMFPKLLDGSNSKHTTGGKTYFSLTETVNNNENAYTKLLLDYLDGTHDRAGNDTFTYDDNSTDYISNRYNFKFHLMIYVNSTYGWVAVDEAQSLNTGEIWVWTSHGRTNNNASANGNIVKLSTLSSTFDRVAGFKFANGSVNYASTQIAFAPQGNNTLGASYIYFGKRYPAGTYPSPVYIPRDAAMQITGVYAGQSITVTPTGIPAKGGSISYAKNNYSTATISGDSSPFTFEAPLNIGSSADSVGEYTFDITPTNPSINDIPAATVTVNVRYSDVQKAYINLYNAYITYDDKGVTEYDTVSGWDDFDGMMETVGNPLNGVVIQKINNPDYVVTYNSTSPSANYYNTTRTNLTNAFNSIVFKTNTIYALVNSDYSDSVKIHVWDTEKQNKLFAAKNSSASVFTGDKLTTVFKGDGTTSEFEIVNVDQILKFTDVKVNGESTSAYTPNLSERTITFDEAPGSGASIVVEYIYSAEDYLMKKEGVTNNGKHLYSFTYKGFCSFIIYYASGNTVLNDDNTSKLTDDVKLNDTADSNANKAYKEVDGIYRYAYGKYYLDIKDVTTSESAGASVSNVKVFEDFTGNSIHINGITNDLFSLCDEEDEGHSLDNITGRLNISYTNSSLAMSAPNGSAQTVNYTSYTITGPVNRPGVVSSPVTVDSTHNWKPNEPGKYEVVPHASLGTPDDSPTACFTADAPILYLYVAYDDIEIYADMNGNVGTPTIHFTYMDTKGTASEEDDEEADLPYEFNLVTGSESIYSCTINVPILYKNYGLDLINHTEVINGQTYYGIQIDRVSVDSVDISNSGFFLDKEAARTGTIWLKADSTHMKSFNKIAYGSSTRTFKAVFRDGNNDDDVDNTFAEVTGTGIITDDLVGESYQYTSYYAAKDPTANYDFSYVLKAKAETEIVRNVENTPNYYYFDHWETTKTFRGNGVAYRFTLSDSQDVSILSVKVGESLTNDFTYYEATGEIVFNFVPSLNSNIEVVCKSNSGSDINILSAPDYDTDANITYVAVYTLTKVLEITYKFNDYNTDDGNYIYDPSKPLKDATYTKTVKWDGTTAPEDVAQTSCPSIKSNYFDYYFSGATQGNTQNNKTYVTVTMTNTPHKYKIVYRGNEEFGYYQQTHTYTTTISNPVWYIESDNDPDHQNGQINQPDDESDDIVIGTGSSYTARFGMYQGDGEITENGTKYKFDFYTIYVKSVDGTNQPVSSIIPAHQEIFYENDTEKARHNFYIIDTTAYGSLVGGGVVYATANGTNGDYRQQSARDTLGTGDTDDIVAYINGILGGNYNKEYAAQTINNIGFRYLPYENGKDVFRYSDVINAYIYTFAGTNTNSSSLGTQTLRVFSYFIYDDDGTKNVVVSSIYAEVSRYIEP